MGAGILLTIGSLVYVILLAIVYFTKSKLRTLENMTFAKIIIVNIIGLFIHVLLYVLMNTLGIHNYLTILTSKLYLVYLITWLILFTVYVLIISLNKREKIIAHYNKIIVSAYLLVLLVSIIIFKLPIQFHLEIGKMYTYGTAVNSIYFISGIFIACNILILLINIKKIIQKKYIPVLIYFVLLSIVTTIQYNYPWIQLMSSLTGFIVFLMYFTIENPDIKMIKELRYSKEMLQRSNMATMNCLDSLSESISKTLGKLFIFGNKKITKNNIDIDSFLDETKDIQKMSVEVVDQINGFIDLSRIESGEYLLHKYDYNTLEMIEKIEELSLIKLGQNKPIKFNISDKIPTVLNGDANKIKQTFIYLINTIMNMIPSCEITVNVSSMEVTSFSRLRFSLSVNYNWEEDEIIQPIIKDRQLDIKSLDYKVFTKLVELQKGKYELKVISSKELEFYFCIDQKANKKYGIGSTDIDNDEYVKPFDALGKRVLLVDDNRKRIKELVKMLQPYNVEIGVAHNYTEYSNILYENKTWDLVLIDDLLPDSDKFEYLNLKMISSKVIFERIQKLAGYTINVVILVTPNDSNKESTYQNANIDYIVKPVSSNKLDSILRKYFIDE